MVAGQLQPLVVNGHGIHQITLPWHWGYMVLSKGVSNNTLAPRICAPNTMILEYGAFLCEISRT
jgi:formate dehydrogenase major subunit